MLADATRVRIVLALKDAGELSVNHLADILDKSPAAVSQHLAKLRLARIVATRQDGQRVFYDWERARRQAGDGCDLPGGALTRRHTAPPPRRSRAGGSVGVRRGIHHPTTTHDHDHDHDHDHTPTGYPRLPLGLFVPHSHDAADSIDDALEASSEGVRALKISLFVLLATTDCMAASSSADPSRSYGDTIHNFSDALTAVPLSWRSPSPGEPPPVATPTDTVAPRTSPGCSSSLVVAVSAVVAAWESIDRLVHPHPAESRLGDRGRRDRVSRQ